METGGGRLAAGDCGYTGSITKVAVGSNGELQAGRFDIVAYGGGGCAYPGSAGGKGAEYGGCPTLTRGE